MTLKPDLFLIHPEFGDDACPGECFLCRYGALAEDVLSSLPLPEGESSNHSTGIANGRALVSDDEPILAVFAGHFGSARAHP